MAINRKFFFDHVRLHLFGGALKPAQVAGLSAILDKWESESPTADDRWLAYMLGTAHHETGRAMQPVRETFADTDAKAIAILDKAFKAGKLFWVSAPYWRLDAKGKCWLGRGFVQITHFDNYKRLGKKLGQDLTSDPNVVMRLPVALNIMFTGMRDGLFTGHKLAGFFNGSKENWVGARRIINDSERAELVADYAKQYYAGISYTV